MHCKYWMNSEALEKSFQTLEQIFDEPGTLQRRPESQGSLWWSEYFRASTGDLVTLPPTITLPMLQQLCAEICYTYCHRWLSILREGLYVLIWTNAQGQVFGDGEFEIYHYWTEESIYTVTRDFDCLWVSEDKPHWYETCPATAENFVAPAFFQFDLSSDCHDLLLKRHGTLLLILRSLEIVY